MTKAWQALDQALQRAPANHTDGSHSTALNALLGERLRARAAATTADPS